MSQILYIDDDVSGREAFTRQFGDDFAVVARPSRDALTLLSMGAISLLVVEHQLEEGDGLELISKAKLDDEHLVCILTAISDIDDAMESIARGTIRGFVKKPWDTEILRPMLRDALALRSMNQRAQIIEKRMRQNERLYALGLSIASVAHELRNPMTVLVGNVDIRQSTFEELRELIAQGEKEGSYELLSELETFAREDSEAVSMMVDICRGVEISGESGDRREYADLNEVVSLTLGISRNAVISKADLLVELDDVPQIRGSRSKLGQVVQNLLINAVQSFGDESKSDEARLHVRLRHEGDLVRLEIEDNGSGIPDEIKDKIFEPFFTTKEELGTGLGLAITRKLVTEMRGDIEVESEPGEGTCFRISFPVPQSN